MIFGTKNTTIVYLEKTELCKKSSLNNCRKKICWITSSFLLDVDIPIVPQLQKEYDIDWIILTTKGNSDGDKKLIEMTGCRHYELVVNQGLFISPRKILFNERLIKRMKETDYNLYYFDFLGMPYFMPMAQWLLPKEKIIVAAHNVKTPKGARYYWLAKPYINEEMVTDNIRVCKEEGNAITASYSYLLYRSNDGDCAKKNINRETFMTLSAPQSFLYRVITDIYNQVEEKNMFDYVEHHTPAIMEELGIPMYFSKGSHTNIKITEKEDVDLFLGYLLTKQYKKEHLNRLL